MSFSNKYNEDTYVVEWFKLYKKSTKKLKLFYINGTFPYRSSTPQVVEFIFNVANEYHLDNTVKYKCVELYDRFVTGYFIKKHKNVLNYHPDEWMKILEKCKKKSFLHVMSCMQLMSKFENQSSNLKLKNIQTILNRTGYKYTKKQILSSELEVVRIIDYKLNEPSILTFVEYFIDGIPFETTNRLYSICLLITDFAYINQQELYDSQQYKKHGYNNSTYIEKLELLDLEYEQITTAAVIIITAFYLLDSSDIKNEELCEYLSKKCHKSVDDLITISTFLISIINRI